jgi:hypothetical protein
VRPGHEGCELLADRLERLVASAVDHDDDLAGLLLDHAADDVAEEVFRFVDDGHDDTRRAPVGAGVGAVARGQHDLDEPQHPDDERVHGEQVELRVPVHHLPDLQNESEHRSLLQRSRVEIPRHREIGGRFG